MTFRPDTPLFLQLPIASSDRVLNPGRCVSSSDANHVRGSFEDPQMPIDDECGVIVYFHRMNEFYKQPARVTSKDRERDELLLDLELVGEPVSADAREHFRVSAYREDVYASMADESSCDVVDVSASGMAVYSSVQRSAGSLIKVTVSFEGDVATGQTSLQSMNRLEGGRFRYGLHCVEPASAPLRKLLLRVCMTLQRRMLTRICGQA